MAAAPASAARLPLPTLNLILAAFLGSALLNLHHLAVWSFPVAVVAALWRWRAAAAGERGLPGRLLRLGALLGLTLAVLGTFRTLNGLAAGATLLTAMGALKLLEATRPRDFAFPIGAALFLLLAACLDAQALWRLPLYAFALWLCCAALLALARGPGASVDAGAVSMHASLRESGRMLLLALPLALLLFLLFPRLPGAFWALPEDSDAVTGLSNEMDPGSIAELSLLDDAAMRVRFDGPAPPRADRYWRGPVLHDFDGRVWRARPRFFARRPPLEFSGTSYRYSVALEPGSLEVLPALELPEGALPPFALLTADYQVVMPRPPSRVMHYSLSSRIRHHSAEPLSALVRRVDLALPRARNPRSVALAQRLRTGAANDRAFIAAVLDRFRNGGFVYTLEPQRLGAQPVDEFLFDTRSGFCGHYASAFVMLMRAAGIPAHVVTGYQGGDWNPIGGYYLVRQSHAHAWAEIWQEGSGWVRVDPTAVVAPARLEGAAIDLLPGAERSGTRLLLRLPWVNSLLQGWDALDSWWQRDIVGFNLERQLDLLDRLGLGEHDWGVLAGLLTAGGIAWAMLVAWSSRRRTAVPGPDALARAWLALGGRLARCGVPRRPDEGPLDYAERAAAAQPALAAQLRQLARDYATLRYGPDPPPAAVDAFRRAVRRFQPPRR
jgi:transglutaminase-like putative cysteine protease